MIVVAVCCCAKLCVLLLSTLPEVWVIILTFVVQVMHMHFTNLFGLQQCLRLDDFHLICQCSIAFHMSPLHGYCLEFTFQSNLECISQRVVPLIHAKEPVLNLAAKVATQGIYKVHRRCSYFYIIRRSTIQELEQSAIPYNVRPQVFVRSLCDVVIGCLLAP